MNDSVIPADQQPQTSIVPLQPPTVNMKALSMSQIRDVGKVMAMSGMFPDIQKDGAKAFVKILAGQEMGIAPFEAMGGISIIQGKATIGGNIMAAKVKGSGKYDYKIKERTNKKCSIEFFEITDGKRESIGVETFDDADAIAAGLAGKDMWKKYPKNMYFNRCISNGVRTYCPDVLGAGPVYTPEEMGATVDEDGNAIIAPNITYTQDTPPNTPPPALPKVTADDEPTDKPIMPHEGNPLQLISDDLLAKGIADKSVRGTIALRVANVTDFSDLGREQWFDVYDRINGLDADQLQSFLPEAAEPEPEIDDTPPEHPDEVVEVTDEDVAAADNGTLLDGVAVANVFGEGAKDETPKPKDDPKKKPALKKPSGSQLAKLTSLYVKNGLKTDKQRANFSTSVIGKNFPASAEEYEQLITELETGDPQ
jgi:hypothetical protein